MTLGICNYVKDLNENGKIDFPEEYFGLKRRFQADELIVMFVLRGDGLENERMNSQLRKTAGKNWNRAIQEKYVKNTQEGVHLHEVNAENKKLRT